MTPTTTPTILQIAVSPNGLVYGLGNDNMLYYWNLQLNDWTQVTK
jgi:hypothetical protein